MVQSTKSRLAILTAIVAMGIATPALAKRPLASHDSSTAVPEPSDLALFLLGVAGVLIGRRTSRRRRARESEDDTNA